MSVVKKLETIFLKLLTWLSLSLTYFFGIGPTALVARLVGKKFLDKNDNQETSWKELTTPTSLERMF